MMSSLRPNRAFDIVESAIIVSQAHQPDELATPPDLLARLLVAKDGEEEHLDFNFEVAVNPQIFTIATERDLVVSDDCALADDIELEFLRHGRRGV